MAAYSSYAAGLGDVIGDAVGVGLALDLIDGLTVRDGSIGPLLMVWSREMANPSPRAKTNSAAASNS
jgi:hypothetical protein